MVGGHIRSISIFYPILNTFCTDHSSPIYKIYYISSSGLLGVQRNMQIESVIMI